VRLPGSGEKGKWTEQDWSLAGRALEALRKPGEPERSRLLSDLRKQRLAPLQKHLEDIKRLLVVPTGLMAKVPVEALTDKYVVSYVPSASVYARRMEGHRALKGDSLFVLADPQFSAEEPPEPPASGVLLTAVVPGGAAEKAGLRPGDVLRRVGGAEVDSPEELAEALRRQPPLAVLAWRDGEQIKARLGGGRLGAAVDKRSAPAAVRAWRKQQQRFASRGGDWQQLPGTRVEMELLKALVPKHHTALSGKEASERRLEQMAEEGELKRFRLLLLATHGEASVVPEQSALILAQHKAPTLEENAARARAGKPGLSNRLTVEAVLRSWELDADLVTLSACESGVGPDGGGEGMLGFAQALLQKGARSVLLSRWKVDDAATSLLMWRFYQNVLGKREDLKKAMGRAEALREAKQWLRTLPRAEAVKHLGKLTDGLPRDVRGKVERLPNKQESAPKDKDDHPFEPPYYWAAFVLIGDPD
jgi:CHAT domain-containing protein